MSHTKQHNIVNMCHLIDYITSIEQEENYKQGYIDAIYSISAALEIDEQLHFHLQRIKRSKKENK